MRHLILILIVALASCKGGKDESSERSRISIPIDSSFALRSLWDDGLAEVATYASTRSVYGVTRSYETTIVTVKEDFNTTYNVKTDSYDRSDLLHLMKVNIASTIRTDSYPYHYMTSLFMRRSDPSFLHKATSSSMEWCGNTFKRFDRDSHFVYTFDSYWDGEGKDTVLLQPQALLEEQLLYVLRALDLQQRRTFTVMLYPSIATNKAAMSAPVVATCTIEKGTYDPVPLQDGSTQPPISCYTVDVRRDSGGLMRYWFGVDYPHMLYQWTSDDGRTMKLASVRRSAYWQH